MGKVPGFPAAHVETEAQSGMACQGQYSQSACARVLPDKASSCFEVSHVSVFEQPLLFLLGSQIKPTSDLGHHLFQEALCPLLSLSQGLSVSLQRLLIEGQWCAVKLSPGALSSSCLSQGCSRAQVLSL